MLQEGAVGVAGYHWLDQIELVHRHQLQDLGTHVAGAIARQRLDDLQMLRRLGPFAADESLRSCASSAGWSASTNA